MYRVDQAECVIHFRVATPQEYVNIYSTRRVAHLWTVGRTGENETVWRTDVKRSRVNSCSPQRARCAPEKKITGQHTRTHTDTGLRVNPSYKLHQQFVARRLKGGLQLLIDRYGKIRFAHVHERVSTQSFVVWIIGNSKSNHLGATGTFKGGGPRRRIVRRRRRRIIIIIIIIFGVTP